MLNNGFHIHDFHIASHKRVKLFKITFSEIWLENYQGFELPVIVRFINNSVFNFYQKLFLEYFCSLHSMKHYY